MKRNNGKKAYLTRRQMLVATGSCGLASFVKNPVDVLIDGIADGIIRNAMAASGANPRNYVYVTLGGAPNRFLFDLPLRPFGGNASPVRYYNTKFGGSGPNAGAPEYATVPITRGGVTLQMPHLWSTNLPTAGGGQVPMADLMTNMLILRGINLGIDGHGQNTDRQIRPVGSAPSLNGAVADGSNAPVPAVGMGFFPQSVYKSNRGIGQVIGRQSGSTNYLTSILSPFNASGDNTTSYISRRNAMDIAIKRAYSSLSDFAKSQAPGAENLFSMRSKAEDLVKAGIGDAATEYPALLAKYNAILAACVSTPIPGVTDRPIVYGDPAIMINEKVSNISVLENEVARNPDLRTLIRSNTYLPYLAEGFAVAEYLLTRGFSSSVVFGTTGLLNVNYVDRFNYVTQTAMGDSPLSQHIFDEHTSGAVNTLILNSFLYRVLAAYLYEFIGALKNRQIFQNTVIQIGSEFGRTPRTDLKGADHGWSAHTTSIFSGAIQRPIVVGNILVDGSSGVQRVAGTWGAAAPTQIDGANRELNIGHQTSTVAQLLRVQPPSPNNGSAVAESSDGSVKQIIEDASQKEKP